MKYFLGIAAGVTLLSNVMLSYYLLRERFGARSPQQMKKEVLNFVLTSDIKMNTSDDTEVLTTEILKKDVGCNG